MSEHDEGKLAGQKVIRLFADLGAEAELKHVLAMGVPSIEEVKSTLQQVWARSSSGAPEARFVGFLSQLIRGRSCSDLLNIWGLQQILDDQAGVAPICNIPSESGLFAFADWTGESDGDCWCYDIPYQSIRCIPVGSGYADANQSRLESYGVFPDLHHFAAYLRCTAELRNRIEPPALDHSDQSENH
jgi:hypothetical protein